MFFKKSQRKEIIVLNVVALIDISSILIIFLVMGTVFSESNVIVPPQVDVPKSSNKDSITHAPQIYIENQNVVANFINQSIPLKNFHNQEGLEAHRKEVINYIKQIPVSQVKSGVLLNLVADKKTPYRDIFDVIKFYRAAGFESILFVAMGE